MTTINITLDFWIKRDDSPLGWKKENKPKVLKSSEIKGHFSVGSNDLMSYV